MSSRDTRPCVFGCGLTAEPGDVYCTGCRSGIERQGEIDRMNRPTRP